MINGPFLGLAQNQSLLASSLQTAYNLGVLPDLISNLLSDISKKVEERIRSTFDLTKISKDAVGKGIVFSLDIQTQLHKSTR